MSKQRNQINYAVACVSEFAHKYGFSLSDAFNFLYDYKAIEFLKEHYDVEHTLPFNDVINDMFAICSKNGGTLQ